MPLGIKLYGMKGEWYQCVHVLKLSETLSESFLHTNGNNLSEIVSVILKSEHRIFILVFSVYFSPCHELDRKAKSLTLASHVSLTMIFIDYTSACTFFRIYFPVNLDMIILFCILTPAPSYQLQVKVVSSWGKSCLVVSCILGRCHLLW